MDFIITNHHKINIKKHHKKISSKHIIIFSKQHHKSITKKKARVMSMSLLNCKIYQLARVSRVADTELVLLIAHGTSFDHQVQFSM